MLNSRRRRNDAQWTESLDRLATQTCVAEASLQSDVVKTNITQRQVAGEVQHRGTIPKKAEPNPFSSCSVVSILSDAQYLLNMFIMIKSGGGGVFF